MSPASGPGGTSSCTAKWTWSLRLSDIVSLQSRVLSVPASGKPPESGSVGADSSDGNGVLICTDTRVRVNEQAAAVTFGARLW